MSKHSHAVILSIFAGIVTEHIGALRDALTKLGAPSPCDEDLHQFRVTLRRLRSAWVSFAPVLPASFVAQWKPRLRALAASTGPVREWDVLLSEWLPAARDSLSKDDEAGRAWLDQAIACAKDARAAAWETLRTELASSEVSLTLLALDDAVAPFHREEDAGAHSRFARRRAEALRKKLIRRGRRPRRAPAPRLHRARIAAKQWRYLYESFYHALGTAAPKRYRAHLRKLQDALGEVHDAEVSLDRVAELLDAPPPNSVVSAFHKRAATARKRAAKGLRWVRRHKAR
ncbi:CHAD domain-containing protein [Ralstonia soli]|uniref:CHAD domain-containing protein n=1 Tax=Ralstonia soli TaxID=2953896 RepID=A0ABT1AQW2_9RALS|nr:CHAD domain-containing protein [Ralstonia soli]MCO5400651.1 CHAD domain-containing protein [Ralstonia soli]